MDHPTVPSSAPAFDSGSSGESDYPLLTPRELEVLKHIARGLSTNEMAEQMNVSFHTVETYRKHLISKFKSKNSAELVKKASKFFWF